MFIRCLFFLLSFGFSSKAHTATGMRQAESPELFTHFWSVAEAIQKIQSRALRSIPLETIIEEGLRAMVNKVDAHSAFFSPKSYHDMVERASGHYAGIGVRIVCKETDADSLLVVEALPGGPADEAGIKDGDAIIKINSQRLRGLTSDEAVTQLKGPIGTSLRVTVLRDKKPLKFTLTRQLIEDRSVFAYFFPEQQAFYIALKAFSETSTKQLADHLTKARETNAQGIVLDLRKNSGGVFEAAIKSASLLLPEGSLVVSTKNKAREVVAMHHTCGTPLHTAGAPLFVLTDNFTASCSEILAGALKHHATLKNMPMFIVGTPTYGKASVQEVLPLRNGCAIKLTTMLYYVAGEHCIQAQGVMPDIVVHPKTVPLLELQWIEELYGKEVALSNHITRAEAEGTEEKKESSPSIETENANEKKPFDREAAEQKRLTNDHVLQTTLTMINAWHLRKLTGAASTSHAEDIAFLKKTVVVAPPVIEKI